MNFFTFLQSQNSPAMHEHFLESDKKMIWILNIHAFVAIFITSSYYGAYWPGILSSIFIIGFVLLAYVALRGTLWFRTIAAISLILFSAVYIQQHLGRIEMHFHVFIALAILTIYKDIIPMLVGSITAIIHHFLFNWMQTQQFYIGTEPVMIFSYGCGIEYVYLHGIMILAETIVLGYIIYGSTTLFLRSIQSQEALDYSFEKLRLFNRTLEHEVQERTNELSHSLEEQIQLSHALKVAKEEADSANKLKSEFIANMSHEIRTPLNSVLGFTDLLEQEIQEPKHRTYLNAIKKGGKNLLTIINDILDLSKIEAGQMKIELQPIHLRPFMMDIMTLFHDLAEQKGLQFECNGGDTIPSWIIADEIHLRQILLNLLSNAIKFTHTGFIRIDVISKPSSDEGHVELIFSISDSGIGISHADQVRIFESFVQKEGQDSRKYGGTGLGLSICKKLATLMGGEISLESEINKGSTFTLTLKNIKLSGPAWNKDNIADTDITTFSPASILVVDHLEENRLLLMEYLKPYGFFIAQASDGLEAIQKMREHHFDLVLMDIPLPKMNGWETIHAIRNELHNHDVSVIAVSASVMKHESEKILENFDALIEKPINKKDLINTLKSFLHYSVESLQQDYIPSETPEIDDTTMTYLKQSLNGKCKESLDVFHSGDMDKIGSFVEVLNKIGENTEFKPLKEYALNLKDAVNSFDIERAEYLLQNYCQIQDTWGIS